MLSYLIEYLGTFLFITVFVATAQPIIISMALLLVLLLGRGGHFNPVTSIVFWVNGALTGTVAIGNIVAQLLGGLSALTIYNYLGPAAAIISPN